MQQYVGKYAVTGMDLTVAVDLRDAEQLVVLVSGQDDQLIEFSQDTTFKLKDQPDYSIEFIKNASGSVTEAIISQPNVTLTATRLEG